MLERDPRARTLSPIAIADPSSLHVQGLRNKKVKGKYGKGSVRTIEGDGLGDVVTDPI